MSALEDRCAWSASRRFSVTSTRLRHAAASRWFRSRATVLDTSWVVAEARRLASSANARWPTVNENHERKPRESCRFWQRCKVLVTSATFDLLSCAAAVQRLANCTHARMAMATCWFMHRRIVLTTSLTWASWACAAKSFARTK